MTSYEGYEISTDSITNANTLFRFVAEYDLTAEQVFYLFVDWHGTQLCTAEFMENTFRIEFDLTADE